MASFGGIGFCCCGGPCPCTVSDDFATDSIAEYDVVGTFAVAAGVLSATTSGTATQTLKLPLPGSTRAAGVKADVVDNSHALFGLTIGIGDNKLTWQWDVAGTQCTFTATSGGTAIVTESYPGAPVTSLEIQIVPNDCAWDVTLYRDGVLVDTHTAVAVTFEEDWTPFGVVADSSGGTWDNLCLRSCGTPCTYGGCDASELKMPVGYSLSAGAFADNGAYSSTYQPTGCCDLLGGEWTLLHHSRALTYIRSILGPSVFLSINPAGNGCSYHAIDAASWVDPEAITSVTGPAECLDVSAVEDGIDTVHNPVQVSGTLRRVTPVIQEVGEVCDSYRVVDGLSGTCAIASPWTINFTVSGSPGSYTVVATASVGFFDNTGGGQGVASYESAPLPVDADNDLASVGPITLNLDSQLLVDGDGDPLCTAPATITIAPLSGAEIAAGDLLFGSDGCTAEGRCSPLYSEFGILSLDGSLIGEEFRVCLSGPAGYSQGPFTGLIDGESQGFTGPCATLDVAVTLECKRVCAHQYQWVLTLDDGTNVIEIPCEPENIHNVAIVVSSPVTFACGSGAFAALLGDFAPPPDDDHPFICACPELNIGLLCANAERWHIAAELLEDSPGSCPGWPGSCTVDEGFLDLTTGPILCGGVPIAPAGFDDSKNYFRGPVPANDSFGSFTDWELVVFCDGGVLKFFNLDASNCVVGGVGTIAAWDCESFTGHIDWQTVSDDCCGSLGSGTIRLALG